MCKQWTLFTAVICVLFDLRLNWKEILIKCERKWIDFLAWDYKHDKRDPIDLLVKQMKYREAILHAIYLKTSINRPFMWWKNCCCCSTATEYVTNQAFELKWKGKLIELTDTDRWSISFQSSNDILTVEFIFVFCTAVNGFCLMLLQHNKQTKKLNAYCIAHIR